MKQLTLNLSDADYLKLQTVAENSHLPLEEWVKAAVDKNLPELIELNEEEMFQIIHGQIIMVNFRADQPYQCGMILDTGEYLGEVYFEDDLIIPIEQNLRQAIYGIGIATLNRSTHTLNRFELKQILSADTSPDQLRQALADFKTEHDTLAHFRASWQEAQAGETYPLSELWDGIDAD